MGAGQVDLRKRTKDFALRVIRLHSALPQNRTARVLGDQVLRSATSVGAHYREAHRARSDAEFISKVETGLQELEETTYWFELLIESELVTARRLSALVEEANELTAIFVTCVKRAKNRHRGAK
jgi:four helix bundle protein